MDLALVLLLARLLFGLAMAAHGAQKLFGWFGGYGLAGTAGFMESLGFKPGRLFTLAAGGSEFAGGLLIAFGLGGPVGPMLVIATMVVAIATVHLGKGFFVSTNGPEVPLLYIALSVVFAVVGYGVYSLDALLGWASVWTATYVWAALGLGVLGGLLNLAVRRKAPQVGGRGLEPAVQRLDLRGTLRRDDLFERRLLGRPVRGFPGGEASLEDADVLEAVGAQLLGDLLGQVAVAFFVVEHDRLVDGDRNRQALGGEQVVRAVAHGAADLAASLVLAHVEDRGAVLTQRKQLVGRYLHPGYPTRRTPEPNERAR